MRTMTPIPLGLFVKKLQSSLGGYDVLFAYFVVEQNGPWALGVVLKWNIFGHIWWTWIYLSYNIQTLKIQLHVLNLNLLLNDKRQTTDNKCTLENYMYGSYGYNNWYLGTGGAPKGSLEGKILDW